MNSYQENNYVQIMGTIVSLPTYSHEVYGEGFYEMKLSVSRLSNASDTIPLTISERLLDGLDISIGASLCVSGQYRSYNKYDGNRSKLMLSVFVREVIQDNNSHNPNIIELEGFICKEPIYRTTPFNREICDILLAVNRAYNKSDYIPCIAWGRNAKYIGSLEIGDKIKISGRIQSREYIKVVNGLEEVKMAYEVSVNKLVGHERDFERAACALDNDDNFPIDN